MAMEKVAEDAIDLAAETLRGDVRDALLGWIRTLQKPYARMKQDEQQAIIESAGRAADNLVRSAVEIIASHGHKVVRATVESMTVKSGIKLVLQSANTPTALSEIGDSIGKAVFLTVADASDFTGEKGAAKADPDQEVIPLHLAKDEEQGEDE